MIMNERKKKNQPFSFFYTISIDDSGYTLMTTDFRLIPHWLGTGTPCISIYTEDIYTALYRVSVKKWTEPQQLENAFAFKKSPKNTCFLFFLQGFDRLTGYSRCELFHPTTFSVSVIFKIQNNSQATKIRSF